MLPGWLGVVVRVCPAWLCGSRGVCGPGFWEESNVVQGQDQDADDFGYWDVEPLPTGSGLVVWDGTIDYAMLCRLTDPVTRQVADAMRAWSLKGWCTRTSLDDDDALVMVVMRRSAAGAMASRMLAEARRCSGGGGGGGLKMRSATLRA